MERLEYKYFKGLEIRCLKCNKTIHRNWKPKDGCHHPIEKTVYRAIAIVPRTKNKRYSKTLKARKYEDAVKECIDFRRDVLNGVYPNKTVREQAKPLLITDCIAMYLDFLGDVDVPQHKKKNNSKGYLVSVRSNFRTYLAFLDTLGLREVLKITDIDSGHVGNYFNYLSGNTASNSTFNHKVKVMRALFEFLITDKKYTIENVFKEIKLKPEKGKDMIITGEDFYALLGKVSAKGSTKRIGNTTRSMYKPWLKDAFKLKAFTGRRDDEIFNMKWSMIHYDRDVPIYLQTPNQKTNRLKNQNTTDELDYVYVPVIEELEEFLKEIGLAEKRGSDAYIIAPEITNRKTMVSQASKSFTFFWNKLNKEYSVQLKHLRSTYITANEIYSFRQGPKLQQHTNFRITNKHYIDQKEIAKFISKDRSEHRFIVFPK